MSQFSPITRRGLSALAMALLAAALMTTPADAGSSKKRVWSNSYGWLYPGRIFVGEPLYLPSGWRAYPISMFSEIYEIRPVNTKTRVNFTTTHRPAKRRHARKTRR